MSSSRRKAKTSRSSGEAPRHNSRALPSSAGNDAPKFLSRALPSSHSKSNTPSSSREISRNNSQASTSMADTGGSKDSKGGDGDATSEYIFNLQQQVYFLELELDVIKKSGACAKCATDGAGLPQFNSRAMPADGMSSTQPLPLYAAQPAAPAMFSSSPSADEKVELLLSLEQAKQHTKIQDERVEEMRLTFNERHSALLEENLAYSAQVERLKEVLQAGEKEKNELANKLAEAQASNELVVQPLKEKVQDLEEALRVSTRRVQQERDKGRRAEIALLEQDERQGRPRRLQQEVAELQKQRVMMEQTLRAATLAKERAVHSKQKADELCATLLKDNTKLRLELQGSSDLVQELEQRADASNRGAGRWAEELVSLRRKVDEAEGEAAARAKATEDMRKKIAYLRKELGAKQVDLHRAQGKAEAAGDKAHKAAMRETEQAKKMAGLQRDLVVERRSANEKEQQILDTRAALAQIASEKNNLERRLKKIDLEREEEQKEREAVAAALLKYGNKMHQRPSAEAAAM